LAAGGWQVSEIGAGTHGFVAADINSLCLHAYVHASQRYKDQPMPAQRNPLFFFEREKAAQLCRLLSFEEWFYF